MNIGIRLQKMTIKEKYLMIFCSFLMVRLGFVFLAAKLFWPRSVLFFGGGRMLGGVLAFWRRSYCWSKTSSSSQLSLTRDAFFRHQSQLISWLWNSIRRPQRLGKWRKPWLFFINPYFLLVIFILQLQRRPSFNQQNGIRHLIHRHRPVQRRISIGILIVQTKLSFN